LKRYNFRKPKRKVGISEQVGSISISASKEEKQKDDLQQYQATPSTKGAYLGTNLMKVHIPNKKCTKRTNQ
jgi:hypothetical protein